MPMQTTEEILREWSNTPRPLKALTKEQLWKYPLADPSADAEWAFSKEVIARRAVHVAFESKARRAQEDVERAKIVLGNARLALVRAGEKKSEAELHGQIEQHTDTVNKLERSVANAEAQVKRLEATAAHLRDDANGKSKRDDMISQEEIDSYYARRYAADWNAILQAWQSGDLFKAQAYGWSSFLGARGSDQRADVETFKRAEGIAILVNQHRGPTFTVMRALYHVRIMPTLTERREFLTDNEPDGQVAVASLKPEQKRRYWRWWRAYNTATLRNQWTDDGGVAYDERQFSPTKIRPEERDDD